MTAEDPVAANGRPPESVEHVRLTCVDLPGKASGTLVVTVDLDGFSYTFEIPA